MYYVTPSGPAFVAGNSFSSCSIVSAGRCADRCGRAEDFAVPGRGADRNRKFHTAISSFVSRRQAGCGCRFRRTGAREGSLFTPSNAPSPILDNIRARGWKPPDRGVSVTCLYLYGMAEESTISWTLLELGIEK
jgi:hypothetical protein